jgi:hypothetical protein
MKQMKRWQSGTALAKRKSQPRFELEFQPQQSVAGAEIVWDAMMSEKPIQLRIIDKRPGDDPGAIGYRSDDEDRRGKLYATNDVEKFLQKTLKSVSEEWGVVVDDDSSLVLEVTLLGFKVVEENQAVGALYSADVRFMFEFKKRNFILSDSVLWKGSEAGDATRYGKKYSNINCNEVLSDALLEAFAAGISSGGLHEAWND